MSSYWFIALIILFILQSTKADCQFQREFYANKNCSLKQEAYTQKFNSDIPPLSGKCYDVRHDSSYQGFIELCKKELKVINVEQYIDGKCI